jgi:hypothetical protein
VSLIPLVYLFPVAQVIGKALMQALANVISDVIEDLKCLVAGHEAERYLVSI